MRISRRSLCGLTLGIGLFINAQASAAQDYSGSYKGPKLAMTIANSGNGYTGQIRLGDQAFPFSAREENGKLVGSFVSGGDRFDFSAALVQGQLTLVSGNNNYDLQRQMTGPGAVGGGASSAVGAANALARYTQVISINSGRTLSIRLANLRSSVDAYKAVFPDLEHFFGARPTITGAYQDGDSDASTFATFDAQLNGQPVKGIVSTRIDSQGLLVYVVYCRADSIFCFRINFQNRRRKKMGNGMTDMF